ncbi:protein of unknown function [Shinella sp. WSC3-e]|nr:hypothetical protein SHINE37_43009 [Rhizobiaceae bacterium]CAK7257568.1 protein of unknown function [Shinella sp. WSC3-e]
MYPGLEALASLTFAMLALRNTRMGAMQIFHFPFIQILLIRPQI